jgi:predicted lipoprotein
MKWINLSLKSSRRRLMLVLTGALLAFGNAASASAAPLTESDVVAALAIQGVQSSLAQVASTANELAASARLLCEKRDAASLEQAREAWRKAYRAWRRATPFLFGPADKLKRPLGSWPVNEVVLDAATASEDLRHLLKQADVRGYGGAEYLLFVPKDASETTAGERCAHLIDVTEEIADLASRAKEEWEQSFGSEFISAGDGKPFLIPADALSLAFAETLNVTERMLRDGIGGPSGFFGEEKAHPERLEAWRSNSSRDTFQATIEGLRLAVIGDGNVGIAGLVATKDGLVSPKDPSLAADMREQFEEIEKTIAGLGDHNLVLYKELQDNPSKLKSLYKKIDKLQKQLVEASLVLELDVRGGEENLAL